MKIEKDVWFKKKKRKFNKKRKWTRKDKENEMIIKLKAWIKYNWWNTTKQLIK